MISEKIAVIAKIIMTIFWGMAIFWKQVYVVISYFNNRILWILFVLQ